MSALTDKLVIALATKGLSYEAQGLIFNSELHPRDDHGMFTKKGTGVFSVLGDIAKGKYQGVAYSGPPGFNHNAPHLAGNTKIGGVVITPPESKGYAFSEHHIDWALHPGEKVFKAHGGPINASKSGVLVQHADGSATTLLATPEGEMPKIGGHFDHLSDALAQLNAGGVTVDTEHPLDENLHEVAKEYDETVEQLIHEKKMGDAPDSAYGGKFLQHVMDDNGQIIGHVEKLPNGKFTSHKAPTGEKIGNISKHLNTAIEKVKSGKLTTPSSYEHKKPLKEAAKAEEPTVSPNKHLQDITDDKGKHLGHIEKTPEGKFTSHDAKGEKIGKTAKHLPTAIAKVHEAAGHTPEAKTEEKPVEETKKVEAPKVDTEPKFDKFYNVSDNDTLAGMVAKDVNINSKTYGMWFPFDAEKNQIGGGVVGLYPVSQAVKANAAEKAAKAKTEEAKKFIVDGEDNKIGYVMKTPEGKWASFDMNDNKLGYTIGDLDKAVGKVLNNNDAKPTLDKLSNEDLMKTIAQITPEPPEVEMPEWEKELLGIGQDTKEFTWGFQGEHVSLKPGQAFYTEKNATGPWGMVVENGKVVDVVNKFNGEHATPVVFGGWQKTLDGEYGTGIIKEAENVVGSEHVTPSAVAEVDDHLKKALEDAAKHQLKFDNGTIVNLTPGETAYLHPNDGAWIEKANGTYNGYLESGKLVVVNSTYLSDIVKGEKDGWKKVAEGPSTASNIPDGKVPHTTYTNTVVPELVFTLFNDGTGMWMWEDNKQIQDAVNAAKTVATIKETPGNTWTEKIVHTLDGPTPSNPVAGATAKPLKKKAVKDGDLPDSFKFPDADKTIKAGIGNSIWVDENSSGTVYHIKSGKVYAFHPDGSALAWLSGDKITLAKAKKNGWTKVAVGEPKQEIELPTGEPNKEFEKSYQLTDHAGWKAVHEVTSYGTPFYEKGLADEETGKSIANAIATLEAGKAAHLDNLSQGDKAKITKALNELKPLLIAHLIAAKFNDPEYEVTDQDKVALNELYPKVKDWNANQKIKALAAEIKTKEFQKSLGDLGFDLTTGSHEEFTNYAIQQGAENVGGMNEEDVKNWVHAHLKAPSYSGPTKATIEGAAAQSLKFKAVAALAEQVAAKKAALAPPKDEQLAAKAIAKSVEHELQIAASLDRKYIGPTGSAIYSPAANKWITSFDDAPAELSPQEMRDYLESHPQMGGNGTKVSNVPAWRATTLENDLGFQNYKEAPAHMLSALGAMGSNYMSHVDRQTWLNAYLRADQVGMYEIEAHAIGQGSNTPISEGSKLLKNHLGSPKLDSGIAARQALSNYLSHQPWWTNKQDPASDIWSEEDVSAAKKALGLDQAAAFTSNGTTDQDLWDWINSHKNLPAPSNQPYSLGEHSSPKLSSKPDDISQEAWDIATGAEVGGPALAKLLGEHGSLPDESVNKYILGASSSIIPEQAKLKLLAAPDGVKKLASLAIVTGSGYSDEGKKWREIAKAIGAKADAGEYLTSDTVTWTTPHGSQLLVPPGAKVYSTPNYSYKHAIVLDGDKSGFGVYSNGEMQKLDSYETPEIVKSPSSKVVFNSPYNLSYDKAENEGQSFSKANFDNVAAAESKPSWTSYNQEEGAAAYHFAKAIKKLPNEGKSYESLTSKLHSFPVGVKQLAVESAQNHDVATLDAILWKHAKGAYELEPEVKEHSLVSPDAPYAEDVAMGHLDSDSIYNQWSSSAMNQFLVDFDLPNQDYSYSYVTKAETIAKKLESLSAAGQLSPASDKAPDHFENLKFAKSGKQYNGMHEKTGYADQFGNEWMAKYYTHDPVSQYRIEAEHYANVIGKMFGYKSAETFVDTLDGRLSLVQKISDNKGDLQATSPSDLNEKQLQSIMQEHVLDWLYSNHDSHYGNLLLHPDGKSIIGIDKGQAFKHLHDDKLAVGYKPPENGDPVWYDKVYKGIADGSISEDAANKIANAVLLKAHQLQTRYDERYKQHVESALTNRPDSFFPEKYPTREEFIQAVMDRKHNLVDDFEKLYKEQFAKAGYEWKIDTAELGNQIGAAHVAPNAAFVAQLADVNAHGLSLFHNSQDIEDLHSIMTPMQQLNGGTGLLWSLKLREDADERATAFMKSITTGNVANGGSYAAKEVNNPTNGLPHVDQFHSSIVNFLKTVNNHAPEGGKNNDGLYNAGYVEQAKKDSLKAMQILNHLGYAEDTTPGKVAQGDDITGPLKLTSMEQQDALKQALKEKLSEYNAVLHAHSVGQKVSIASPGLGQLEPLPPYTPSKGLTTNEKAFPLETYKLSDDEYAIKMSDGGHLFTDTPTPGVGFGIYADPQDYKNAIAKPEAAWVPSEGSKSPQWTSANGSQKITQQNDNAWLHTDNFTHTAQVLTPNEVTNLVESSPENTWEFKTNQREVSQVVQAPTKQIKVSHRPSSGHAGQRDPSTGKMVETQTQKGNSELHTGHEYTVEHDNVKIHYRPWKEAGVARAQQGLMSIEIKNWDKNTGDINNVLDTLNLLGVDVTPADAHSLELGYWRMNTGAIQQRGDSNEGASKKTIQAFKKAQSENPHMSEDEELDAHRAAWKEGFGIDPESIDWAPKFNSAYGQDNVGRPHWYRPDYSLEQLKAQYDKNGGYLPMHSVDTASGVDDADDRAFNIIAGGRLLSTEERLRVLGKGIQGASSSSDQSYGSSAFNFLRQNLKIQTGNDFSYSSAEDRESTPRFILSPEQMLYHSNYAFNYDAWGKLDERSTQSHYAPSTMYDYGKDGSSGNEILVKNEALITHAIFSTAKQRDRIMARLKAEGFDEINGRKLEEIMVTENEWAKNYKQETEKVWKRLLEAAKEGQE